jgi:hypothetical protein
MGVGFLMNAPTGPFFVVDGLDVTVYASLEDVEQTLEPEDVVAGGLAVYDAEGRMLELKKSAWRVRAFLGGPEATQRDRLEESLRAFLGARNEPVASDPRSILSDLVAVSRRYIRRPLTMEGLLRRAWGWLRKR